MFHQPVDAKRVRRRALRTDVLLAIVIAVILSVGWGVADWARLRHMILPDTDDMVRLAQVRDWLAGQATNDWTQYRIAPPAGAPMHWSRINDVGIAALILAMTPLVGRHYAELTAVLLYPGLLFACALFLSARIGRRLWGAEGGSVAAVLTALAYPGTTVFVPGRIDHHALQVVLVQLTALMLMRSPSRLSGGIAGLAAALSLIVGLETAPQIVALLAVGFALWVVRGARERDRMFGFGAAFGGTTLTFLALLRPTYWNPALCDAFTPASSTGMVAVSCAFLALAAISPRLSDWRGRAGVGTVLGGGALAVTLYLFPSCLTGPYGAVDPFLRAAFLPYIEEANGVVALHDVSRMIAVAGVLTAAAAASIWVTVRQRRRWPIVLPIAAVVLISAAVMLTQVRGAYIGAPLGASVLAGLIIRARQRMRGGGALVATAWLAAAGPTYAVLPKWFAPPVASPAGANQVATPSAGGTTASCNSGDVWEQIDRYPPGVVMTPTMMAAYLIGATHMSSVGAGYHRNNVGTMAMYRFFLAPPDKSRAIARDWKTNYVLFCPGDFGEIDVVKAYPDSLATGLQRGKAPGWLRLVPLRGTQLQFYRIVQ
ncbi:MAG: hypothetical protein ABIQ43_05400 [Sphingomonas sp.]